MARNQFAVDHDACGVGFVTRLGHRGSHEIVERALTALARLAHRGGVDADGRSGDGAGLLTTILFFFKQKTAYDIGIDLPGVFGLGMVFLARDKQIEMTEAIEASSAELGLHCRGWREVPTDPSILGPRSMDALPLVRQCFFTAIQQGANLESLLFRLRKK